MALISQSLPNFVNGVSQQPFTLRLSSQGDLQENGYSTAASGLKKRPPTQYLGRAPILDANMHVHTINRDSSERYVVVISAGNLRVFDLNGTAQTVNFPNGWGYLTTSGTGLVQTQFACCSVADYTFVVNKNVTVTQSATITPFRNKEALINVKAGNYSKQYKVYVNGGLAANYTTPDGSLPAHLAQISTDYIANQLTGQLIANGITPANGWNIAQYGSIIHLVNITGAPFGLVVEDGFNNNAMTAVKDRVAKFSDLPAYARAYGFTIAVAGDNSSNADDYWVTYSPNPGGMGVSNTDGAGVWKECAAPSSNDGVNVATMPWVLIREANGTFTFKVADWNKRLAGDATTNADLSFVGDKINDVFFYRNRLGFLSGENVCMSEAGEFFNFYRISVITNLDSDPIDVASTSTKVSILKNAVQFNKQLLLFSAESQFVIDEPGILTASTAAVKLASEFPSNANARPVVTGKNVYFPVTKGQWSAVREYYVDTNALQNDAADVTAHVPKYIPSNISKMSASANEDVLVCLSSDDRTAVYVYKYYYSGDQKLQASWSKWVFGASGGIQVLGMEIIDSYLYLFIWRDTNLYFERLDLAPGATLNNEPFPVHLDRKYTVPRAKVFFDGQVTYIFGTDVGQLFNGYGTYTAVIANSNPTGKPGEILKMSVNPDANTVFVLGDYRNNELILGADYSFRYVLSTITVKQATEGGQKSDTEGRLQLRKIGFNYADSGMFDVKVTPMGRDTSAYRFAGKILGISAILGQISLPTGRFAVPVLSRNVGTTIELFNDSPLPSSFLSADWEGFYVKRSQSV